MTPLTPEPTKVHDELKESPSPGKATPGTHGTQSSVDLLRFGSSRRTLAARAAISAIGKEWGVDSGGTVHMPEAENSGAQPGSLCVKLQLTFEDILIDFPPLEEEEIAQALKVPLKYSRRMG
ncbi:hypothetical protein ACP70R_025131 [Stipagrostis hirtigluma subsp. patula]